MHLSRKLLAVLSSTVVLVAISGAFVAASATSSQQNDGPPGNSHSITDDEISIQLWNFAAYVGFGTDAATQARAEEVLRRLSEIGYRNVEPFTFNGRTAAQFKACSTSTTSRRRHATVTSRSPTSPGRWRTPRRCARRTSARADSPRRGSRRRTTADQHNGYENTLATAIVMNELGRRSVRNGTGKFYGHNHQGEFRTQYADPVTGQMKSAWQILVENTDPRYVAFQLDVLWATDGGADPVDLLNRFGDRIFALHVKDGINVADPANATPVPMGEGEIDLRADPAGGRRLREAVRLRAGSALHRSDLRPVRVRPGGLRLPRQRAVLTARLGGALAGPAGFAVHRAGKATHMAKQRKLNRRTFIGAAAGAAGATALGGSGPSLSLGHGTGTRAATGPARPARPPAVGDPRLDHAPRQSGDRLPRGPELPA